MRYLYLVRYWYNLAISCDKYLLFVVYVLQFLQS